VIPVSSIRSFPDVLRLLRRRVWLVLLVATLGSILTLALVLSRPKEFEATAVIQIESPQVGQSADAQVLATDARMRLQLIEQRLMARDHVVELIERHGLFAGAADMPLAEKVYRMRLATRIEPISVTVPGMPPGASTPSGLSVTVTLDDPDKAAAVANEFVASVISQNRARRLETVRDTLDFFSEEEDRINAAIAALEARIVEFKRANSEALPESVTAQRSELSSLRETLLGIEREIVTLETQASRQRQEVFDRQIGQLRDQRALVTERIAGIEAALAAAPRVERELGALNRDLAQLQDQLATITRSRAEAEMASVLEARQQQERFEILETAIPPVTPVSASRKKLALAGGVASLLAGIALALVLEILTPALRTAAQLRDELDITPVVTIPEVRLPRERRARMLRRAGILLGALLVLPFLARLLLERLGPLRLPAAN
jgi:uncharacterized protein involved in exopolysaccharide biosynthesis